MVANNYFYLLFLYIIYFLYFVAQVMHVSASSNKCVEKIKVIETMIYIYIYTHTFPIKTSII